MSPSAKRTAVTPQVRATARVLRPPHSSSPPDGQLDPQGRRDKYQNRNISLQSEDRTDLEGRVAELISESLRRSADLMSEMVTSLGTTIAELQTRGDRIDRRLAATQTVLNRLVGSRQME
ncbi:MAG: hypothetical protein JO163_03340 [Methylobacteriaceae bacterium]|nr:hypothetical protein [Methylobacteriaceae bacterium]